MPALVSAGERGALLARRDVLLALCRVPYAPCPQRAAHLDPSSSGDEDMASASSTAVHWAQPLGRPEELVAFACGPSVFVYAVKGDACGGALGAEQVTELGPFSDVHQVEFDALGSQLGVADEQGIHVYRCHGWGRAVQLVPDAGPGEDMVGQREDSID